ncbi:MAG: peptidase C45 [Chitinophagales bacterium]|nr:peptidase C45 [Chitinophagaceae bacterium]MCB9065728.1 peptidase C45 [Chitinophagales bacterium]
MRFLRRLLKIIGIIIGVLILFLVVFCIYVYNVSDYDPPSVEGERDITSEQRKHVEGSLYTLEDSSWIKRNDYGLYEMYVSGAEPFEFGTKNGKLARELIVSQEVAFTDEIKRMIPSDGYLKFLKYIIGFMNKDLPDHVTDEYKKEIYGISLAASDSFDWIGDKYDRILNYHAAHDIGHALQNMMLVGCTSFGAWSDKTEDGSMLLGRNFDFWVGDKFAENKIVAFYDPGKGYKFAFVTWGGFTGVVSGMNEQGLTVTINAAKSKIPFGAATPVSMVAREVLQYASNINDAIAIAKSREMFVSESFLVGSAKDRKAVIIEKTPDELAVYDPSSDHILCTNHYQSKEFEEQKLNKEQKERSASVYRYQRLQELTERNYPLTPLKVADILRDRGGLHDANIGNGNEKAVNQLIAHHSVIFQPDSLRMWVSTNNWQLGAYVCYDLGKIFSMKGLLKDTVIYEENKNIPADDFVFSREYRDFIRFRKNKMAFLHGKPVDTVEIVRSNPEYYDAYRIAGDYCFKHNWYGEAEAYYRQALTLEIATVDEREAIEEKITLCKKKLKR